jgi:hypothetical protein
VACSCSRHLKQVINGCGEYLHFQMPVVTDWDKVVMEGRNEVIFSTHSGCNSGYFGEYLD